MFTPLHLQEESRKSASPFARAATSVWYLGDPKLLVKFQIRVQVALFLSLFNHEINKADNFLGFSKNEMCYLNQMTLILNI